MTVTLAVGHYDECPCIRTQAAEEVLSVHGAKTLCQSINGLISRAALPKGTVNRLLIQNCLELSSIAFCAGNEQYLRIKPETWNKLEVEGSTVTCCSIQVSVIRSALASLCHFASDQHVYSSQYFQMLVSSFSSSTSPGPLVYPFEAERRKGLASVPVRPSGCTNRHVLVSTLQGHSVVFFF